MFNSQNQLSDEIDCENNSVLDLLDITSISDSNSENDDVDDNDNGSLETFHSNNNEMKYSVFRQCHLCSTYERSWIFITKETPPLMYWAIAAANSVRSCWSCNAGMITAELQVLSKMNQWVKLNIELKEAMLWTNQEKEWMQNAKEIIEELDKIQ